MQIKIEVAVHIPCSGKEGRPLPYNIGKAVSDVQRFIYRTALRAVEDVVSYR